MRLPPAGAGAFVRPFIEPLPGPHNLQVLIDWPCPPVGGSGGRHCAPIVGLRTGARRSVGRIHPNQTLVDGPADYILTRWGGGADAAGERCASQLYGVSALVEASIH